MIPGLEILLGDSPGALPDPSLPIPGRVVVVERLGQPAAWELHYGLIGGESDLPLLIDDRFAASGAFALVLRHRGGDQCLAAGPVQGQRIEIKRGTAGSTLVVLGGDLTRRMDREAKIVEHAAGDDLEAVRVAVTAHGMTLASDPATGISRDLAGGTLMQRGTDLHFVQRLARRHGRRFWVRSSPELVHTARFAAPDPAGEAVATLSVEPEGALEAVQISWDSEQPTAASATDIDAVSGETVSSQTMPTPAGLGAMPLNALVDAPRSALIGSAGDSLAELTARSDATVAAGAWFLRARATVLIDRVEVVPRVDDHVRLEGLGSRHSGRWHVLGATYRLQAVGSEVELDLRRDGWGPG